MNRWLVGQTFVSAGSGDFPVVPALAGSKARRTGRLESLPYAAVHGR
jgi:hypothetical protein